MPLNNANKLNSYILINSQSNELKEELQPMLEFQLIVMIKKVHLTLKNHFMKDTSKKIHYGNL